MTRLPWLNVGCGPHRAPDPWVNLDCHRGDGVEPDVLVDEHAPLSGYASQSVDRVYLGHVLEHVMWPLVPAFMADVKRVLTPDGQVLVIGPDVLRTIIGWRDGSETWDLVLSTLEAMDGDAPDQVGQWGAACHKWNCHESRVIDLLTACGFDAVAIPLASSDLDGWPVVSRAPWQLAVAASISSAGEPSARPSTSMTHSTVVQL